ncbi:helix-turn-helix domain-containing protein [Nocardia wallacei]|uniref:helix-turn-helix domain-containing protein n=1 Tax=Nocardia wallacei TaxID=480035 RepID=UPI002454BF5B|nr:helix-turn-helix transcriptional regulator [Nocardia wallacei]
MPDTGSTLPRRQLGRYLRDLRQQAGLTLAEAARLVERSPSSLQRLETGQAERIRLIEIRELCRLYDADEMTTAGILGLAQQASVKSWWHRYGDLIPKDFDVYIGLEAAARQLTSYAPDVILGLLQTPAYTRTLLHSFYPDNTPEEIDQRVALKQKRQALIKRKRNPARLDVVLLEAVLHRMVGGPQVMAAQLRHLANVSTLPNVSLHILPLRAGIPLGDPIGLFTIIDFPYDSKGRPIEPSVVYLENFTGSLYLENAEDVERYHEAYQAIRHAALDETRSRDLIRRVAKEYLS